MSTKRQIILLAALGVFFLGTTQAFSQALESNSTKIPIVKTDFIQELFLTADIAPSRQVQLMPEIGGTLKEIFGELGSKVEKGQVIAKVDSADIVFQVKQAEAALLSARANYRKVQSIVEVQAETNFKKAEAAFKAAQAQLDLLKATAETEFFSGFQQAQAAFKIAQANLTKAKEGARLEEIQGVEAAYQQALANFHNAEKDLQRAEDDYNRGAIPEQALDKTQLGFEIAQAQLTSAKAALELIKKGAREEDMQMAEAQVQQAKAALDSLEKLKEAKTWEVKIQGTQAQWENAKSILELAKTAWEDKLWEEDIELAKTQVQQAEAALELAKSYLKDCTIKSPISGIIGERFVEEGSLVGPAVPLVSIVDINSVKIILHIGEENLDKIFLTEKVVVQIENYLEETFTPQEINISPTMDPRSRKIKVEIKIINPDLRIKPGMFARVKLLLKEEK